MLGIDLPTLKKTLSPVESSWDEKPINTIADLSKKPIVAEIYDGDVDSFIENCHRIPEEYLTHFSFEELCKINYSSIFMTSGRFGELFTEDAPYEVTRKIRNSMWRWDIHSAGWNETVSAYNGIQNFTIDLGKDFCVRLDYTTGCNKIGYSKFSRTFLDGVFAFLVYHKGVHVMTIGFSIHGNEKIVIRQVQLVQQKGNRWLYKLPNERLPFVIERMMLAFPEHSLYIVDGGELVDSIIANYIRGQNDAIHWRKKYLSYALQCEASEDKERYTANAQRHYEEIAILSTKIKSLQNDRNRLVAFYNSTRPYRLKMEPKKPGSPRRLVA